MQQTFVKTIQGHEIEFVRLLYPLHYTLIIRAFNENPLKVRYEKDENNVWVVQSKEAPGWVNEISHHIHEVIQENEAGCRVRG